MNDTSLKFQCKVSDLVNAMESYGDVQNIVIEDENDAIGAINFLIGFIGDDTYYEGEERPCSKRVKVAECKVSGEIMVVKLEATDEDYRNEFTRCVKKLQKLITSNKKGV